MLKVDWLNLPRLTLSSLHLVLHVVQAYVRHPELAAARANRDFVLKQVCDAVSTISGAAQAAGVAAVHPYESSGELAAALNDFDVRLRCLVLHALDAEFRTISRHWFCKFKFRTSKVG